MKNLKGLFVASVIVMASSAVMAAESNFEYYAHPTMFGTQSQTTVGAGLNDNSAYVVGEKKLTPDTQTAMKGKSNVLVNSFVKDVMKILENNSTEKVFNPKMPILRSELAVVLSEGLSIKEVTPKYQYTDISSNYWAKSWIDKALSEGIMIGYPDKKFRPDQPITKAEVFATLAQLINVPTDGTSTLPKFQGYTMEQIPNWAIAPTKEVMASTLLDEIPDPEKVAKCKYLSKTQVAYLVGVLRQNYLCNEGSSLYKKYAPSYVTATINERVDARHANIGELFTATTTKAVTINGTEFVAGSTVVGEVVGISRPGYKNPGYVKVKFTKIQNGKCCAELPKNVSEVQAKTCKRVNPVARIFAAPFSASGRVLGVAGRTGAAALNVAANGTERYGDNWSNAFADGLSLKGKPAAKNVGRSFMTVGLGVFDIAKLAVSGTAGVLYELGDEVVYLILPSKSADSSLNPNDEILIIY